MSGPVAAARNLAQEVATAALGVQGTFMSIQVALCCGCMGAIGHIAWEASSTLALHAGTLCLCNMGVVTGVALEVATAIPSEPNARLSLQTSCAPSNSRAMEHISPEFMTAALTLPDSCSSGHSV
eukprot:gnl/TRDRNA2_/TRDRNA2_174272_c10_seq1.p1 gnl/TRDRNA2_/TRDRNA2_174272_c10~~gnl/TRDRNA2_/TRDRNA2_174272_c10_seq1.p1  ORF type:complete len:125 (+),score=8.74 gnl/TRDRNA2_/TRDRNA2_174272_c10_seq1:614-988(+)